MQKSPAFREIESAITIQIVTGQHSTQAVGRAGGRRRLFGFPSFTGGYVLLFVCS
jgi:hypothetical protein